MRTVLIIIQCSTYVALGSLLIGEDKWKLGLAQLCLAVVQGLLFG